MITASHNPREYNGVKVIEADALRYLMRRSS
jgi:Phosphomannomutase